MSQTSTFYWEIQTFRQKKSDGALELNLTALMETLTEYHLVPEVELLCKAEKKASLIFPILFLAHRNRLGSFEKDED